MITTLMAACVMAQAGLPPLKVEGRNFVDPTGKTVTLKGCNVGNWFVIEFWMLGFAGRDGTPGDQYRLEETLTKRFGASENARLMQLYRSSWMTERDWQNIQSYGFNVVRVPLNYRLFEDDANPFHLKKDAWKWIDNAVNEAEKHGLYSILDLHGVQGGQTPNDHTGRSGQNKLWSVPENQDRMAWLWKQIAARYRNRSAVIAYDPMNEPYGGQKNEVLQVFEKSYRSIRSVDPEKLIFAHGHTDNFDHFGDPKTHGWHNVGFQMHYYPGLFGDPSRVKSTLRHLNSLSLVHDKLVKLNVPFLVGEMNVVLKQSGGAPMMRAFFDKHAEYGWITTMWSYKVINEDAKSDGGSWGMFLNANPGQYIDFNRASKAEIEAYFKSFSTMKLQRYDALYEALKAKTPPMIAMPPEEIPVTKAPADEPLAGWTSTDIQSLKGGLVRHANGKFDLYGGGDDIWNDTDSFRFLHRTATRDFDLSVTVDSLGETSSYAKAGLMVRLGTAPNSPTMLMSTFPDGTVQFGTRTATGATMTGTDGLSAKMPGLKLRVVRSSGKLTFYANGRQLQSVTVPTLTGTVEVGPIALSHSGGELTKVEYRDLQFSSN